MTKEADSRATDRQLFPGVAGAIGLIVTLLFLMAVIADCLYKWGIVARNAPAMQASVLAMVLANGILTAFFLGRRGLGYRAVVHPAAASLRATAGVLAVPVLLLVPAVYVLASLANEAMNWWMPMAESQRRMFEYMMGGGLSSIVGVAIAAPFFEEMLFRGIILRGLLARMRPAAAVVVSALIFGAAHLNLYQFVVGTLIGLPLGWLYLRFRSTVPCMLLHGGFNVVALAATQVAREGTSGAELPLWMLIGSVLAFLAGATMLSALTRLRQSRA